MSLSSLWRLTPLAAALLICSEAHALELQPQVITGNPLGSEQLASPTTVLEGDELTLQHVLTTLVEHYEWDGLAERIDIRCFKSDPSIKSSLTFLRKTPWAREKVEGLYVKLMRTKRPLD